MEGDRLSSLSINFSLLLQEPEEESKGEEVLCVVLRSPSIQLLLSFSVFLLFSVVLSFSGFCLRPIHSDFIAFSFSDLLSRFFAFFFSLSFCSFE